MSCCLFVVGLCFVDVICKKYLFESCVLGASRILWN